MLLASPHQAPNCDDRRVHDTQLPLAGQEGAAAEQEGHGAGHMSAPRCQLICIPSLYNTRIFVAFPTICENTINNVNADDLDRKRYCVQYIQICVFALYKGFHLKL